MHTPAPGPTVTLHLSHLPEGVATLSWTATTRRVGLHLDMYGVIAGGTVSVSLRRGHCLDVSPGASLVDFPAATADASGDLRTDLVSTGTVSGGIPQGADIDVDGAGGVMLACTDIPASGATAPQRLYAPPRFKPGATATVSPRTGGDDLHLVAVDLAGGGRYAVEVRSGTCQASGALLASVGRFTAGRGGAADWQARIALRTALGATGWALLVLDAGAGTARPAGQPVLCGSAGG